MIDQEEQKLKEVRKSLDNVYDFAVKNKQDLMKVASTNPYELIVLFAGLLLEDELVAKGKPSPFIMHPMVPMQMDMRSPEEKFDDSEMNDKKKTYH